MRHRTRYGLLLGAALSGALALSACGGGDAEYEVRIGWGSSPCREDRFERCPAFDPGEDFLSPDGLAAQILAAPPHDAIVSGVIRLEVAGRNMRRVALLPPDADEPVYAWFTVHPYGDYAYASFDSRSVPDGPLQVRVLAYGDRSDRFGRSEALAMPVRTWRILNRG